VRRRWTLRLVGGLAVASALVSSCASRQEASDTLPSAGETSSSPELAPLGPPDFPVPDEARTQDAAGAEAFMRYYLNLYNHSTTHLNSRYLRDLSRDCTICSNLATQIDEVVRDGYRYQGGEVRVDAMSPASVQNGQARLAFGITESELAIVDSLQTPVPERQYLERTSPSCGAILFWSPNKSSWLVKQLDIG
jgi:hypothetical protein